ncbi:MAG: adenylate cyclase [Actinomycetota bacterium]|jgi:class 3 adenylate cyclase
MSDADEIELVWQGPFASLPRPMDLGAVRSLAAAAGTFLVLAALAVLPWLLGWTDVPGSNKAGLTAVLVGVVVAAGFQFTLRSASPGQIERLHPNTIVGTFVLGILLVASAVYFAGPSFGQVAVFFGEVPLLAFFALRTKWAVAATVASLAGYGAVLVLLDGPPAPTQQFIDIVASAAAAGLLIGGLASRLDEARLALADLNRHLELRVTEQVDELERTGRLRRFLSPQIADVVMSVGAEVTLAPHRCEVAVLFVDLRGFTHFTNSVDAGRVMQVLGEYYNVVGSILDRHGATIGGFDGDGVMAYFGDPVPVDMPAREALMTAGEIADELDGFLDGWSTTDARLGYGIGVAFGLATLGVVGFEGRSDYTPVGAVVNLAARLCSDAVSGEIVIDAEVRAMAVVTDATRRADVDLKGFGTVPTYSMARPSVAQ